MKFSRVSLALLGLCLLNLPAAVAGDDEAQLRELKTVLWQRAYREQDTALLDQILHESFQLIDAEGGHSNKQQELQWIAANAWNPGEFEYRIERLDIYDGQFVIVAGRGLASNYSYSSSNVLIKQDGRWQAISSHVSGYQQH